VRGLLEGVEDVRVLDAEGLVVGLGVDVQAEFEVFQEGAPFLSELNGAPVYCGGDLDMPGEVPGDADV